MEKLKLSAYLHFLSFIENSKLQIITIRDLSLCVPFPSYWFTPSVIFKSSLCL
jgi:hypothetical protein